MWGGAARQRRATRASRRREPAPSSTPSSPSSPPSDDSGEEEADFVTTGPFQDATVVYNGDRFSLSVRRTHHQRNRRFRAQDLLYEIKVDRKSSAPILLQDMTDAIRSALNNVLRRVQAHCEEDEEANEEHDQHQVGFDCICQFSKWLNMSCNPSST